MKSMKTITILGIMMFIGISIPFANAANTINADPSDVPLNGTTDITLCVDNDTDVNSIGIIDPDGTILEQKSVSIPIVGGDCYTWTVPDAFDAVTLNQPGPWSFFVNTEQGIPIYSDFQVSFFVLPETAIGAIGAVGAMVAALGMYTMKKRN
ncbi:MAG: hypothetical protein KatS3mg003_0234 [Candidatus Nitrosocaldaceae archaeon]|nr:MAG: hypothetical protein KatS3mg003_0234 [Candidatus Nitrosocaldaceae archaeon]